MNKIKEKLNDIINSVEKFIDSLNEDEKSYQEISDLKNLNDDLKEELKDEKIIFALEEELKWKN